MPTYEYACTSCGERLEVVQRFSDEPLTVCRTCEGALRKVFSPVGVVFKGSGFYKTDSRGSKSSAAKETKPDAATTSPAEDKPAPSKPADSPSTGSSSGDSKPATDSGGSSGERVA